MMRARRVTKCEGLNRTGPQHPGGRTPSRVLRAYLGLSGVVLVLIVSAFAVSAQAGDDLDKREVRDTVEDPSDQVGKQTVDEVLDPQDSSGNGTSLKQKIHSMQNSSDDDEQDPDGPQDADDADADDVDDPADPDEPDRTSDPEDEAGAGQDRGHTEAHPVDPRDPECIAAVFQQSCGQRPQGDRDRPGEHAEVSDADAKTSGSGGPASTGGSPQAETLEESPAVKETSATGQTALQAASGSGLAILLAWTLFVASAGSYDRSKTRLEKREQTADPSVNERGIQIPRQSARAATGRSRSDVEGRVPPGKSRKGRA